jgi:hypothetical protein
MNPSGSGGGLFGNVGTYLRDGSFWLSVVVVNLVVAMALVMVGAPGYRR